MIRFFTSLFIFLSLANETVTMAQCTMSASISGNSCAGHALTAVTSSVPSSIAWQQNGVTVYTSYPSQWSSQGIVVAGGNGPGSGSNQFGIQTQSYSSSSSGIAVDKYGNVYVCDDPNNRVQKWAPGADSGITVAGGNGQGNAANQLYLPADVFVDDTGNVYVADLENARIQKWAPGATSGITVAGGNFFGSGANQFGSASQVVVDKEGNIYVADDQNFRVQKWAPGATSGITVAGGNGNGSAANQISYYNYIFVDDSGNVYVSDEFNHRVQKWASGADSGVIVAGGNGYGMELNQLAYPTGVFVDGSGNVFVATGSSGTISPRIMEWKKGATEGIKVTGGFVGSDPNYFTNSDIVMDANGNLIILDPYNFRVLQFNLINPDYSYTPSAQGDYQAVATSFNSSCAATSNSISVAPAPMINSSVNGSICAGNGVTLTASGGSIFTWQPGNLPGATQTFYPTITTTYSVSSDVNSCVSEITIPVLPTPAISISGAGCTNHILTALVDILPAAITWQKNGVAQESDPVSWNTSGVTVAGGNGQGGGLNQFSYPIQGIFVDAQGNLYVSDHGNYRVLKFAPGETIGTVVAGGNGYGSTDFQLYGNEGIYVDAAGNVYVADANNNRVVKWAPGASTGTTVAGGNGFGSDLNQLEYPSAVCADASGNVYVLDGVSNARVMLWAPGATQGIVVAGGNGQGNADNQMNLGTGMVVDEDGTIYVDDWYANRVQKWAPGATSGITIMSNLYSAYGLWRDAAGYFYVMNQPYIQQTYTSQVVRFKEGDYQWKTIIPASYGSGASQFASADDGFIDAQGNMYILDGSNQRVQKFTPSSINTTFSPLTAGDYTALATSFTGCASSSNTIHTLTSPVVILGNVSVCSGSGTTLSVSSSGSFTWNPGGESGSSVTVSPTATTTYTITDDSNNCQSTITVNVNPLITDSLTGPNCLGSGNLSTSIGSTPLQLDWKLNGTTIQSSTASYSYWNSSVVFGGNGNGTGLNQLGAPEHICFDDAGNLYISELANSRVTRWAPGATQGVIVAGGNGQGPSDNQVTWPYGVFVDHSGNLYVSDWINHRVQKWAPGATEGITVAGGNGEGSALNQLDFPSGIDVDGAGNIYIADQDNSRVVEWAPGAAQGVIVAGGNGQGSAANQFNGAIDVHVDQSGNIYVCDQSNHRIQKWAPGATSGVTIAGDGTLGYGPVELNYPEGFAFDGAGDMYIMNTYYNTIWKWAPGATQGVYLAAYCCSGQGSLQNATDVAIDASGNLYACDVGADKIVKYPVNSFSTTYNPTSAGIYSVVATSFVGCASTSNSIDIHPIPNLTLTGNQYFCTGNTTALDAASHQTYLWSTGSTSESQTFGTAGKYGITVTDSGCSKTDSFSINNATPQVQATASSTTVCGGQFTILNVQLLSGNGQGNSYTWSPGNLNGASVQVTPSATTTYTLTATNSGCSSTSSVTVNLTSPAGDPSVFGSNVWNVYAWNAGGQYDYGQSWNTNYAGYYVDTTLNFNSENSWDPLASPSSAPGYQGCPVQVDNMSWSAKRKGFPCGIYQIDIPLHDDEEELFVNGNQVSTSYCCGVVSNVWKGELDANSTVEFRITEGGGNSNGALTFTITPVSIISQGNLSTICEGYLLPLTVDTTGAASYLWSTGATTSSINVGAGSYKVIVNYRGGCSSTSDSFAVAVAPIDTPEYFSYTGLAFCPITGYVDVQDTNFNPLLNYSWDSQNASYYGGGYSSITAPGNYTLTASDPLGCSAQTHITVTGPPGTDSAFGENAWKVNAYDQGFQEYSGYTYGRAWFPADYSGYYTDTTLNFNSADRWDVNSNPSTASGYQGCYVYDDDISWSAKRRGFACGIYKIDVLNHDDDADLLVNGVEVWSHFNGCCDSHYDVWTGPLNENSTVEFRVNELYGATVGTLQFTRVDTSANFIVIGGNPVVCTGQSYTLISSLHGNYAWSSGQTTNPIQASSSGSYSVTVTDQNGCSITSDPINVDILPNAAPVAHITTSSNIVCNRNPVTLSSDSSSGNHWTTNDSTQNISVISAGNYKLTITNSVGCSAQDSIHIGNGFTPPTPPVVSNSGPVCQNTSVNLTASGLAPGGQVASFNNSGYINVLQDIPENDFTIEMWVKTTASNAGIFSATDDNSGSYDRDLYLYHGQLWIRVYSTTTWNTGFTINDGQWHHIALVVQSGVGQTVYVDGVSSGIGNTYDHSDFYWQTAFRIGYSLDALNPQFTGQIDNVRIWSEARTQDDIRNNMFFETPTLTANLVYEGKLNGSLNALVGVNGTGNGSISYSNQDYYTYTWTGAGAPPPSTSETQTIASIASSGTYSVTASTAGGCSASPIASTSVTVTPSVNYYADVDGDGYGSSTAVAISSCTNPGAGYVTNNTDCNDDNASVHPGATEVCNGIDDNCNGQVDEGAGATYYADADGDGYGNPAVSVQSCSQPVGYVSNNTDCNDGNKNVHPGAADICNGIDDNCNGVVDENAISATIIPDGSVTFCAGTSLTLTANSGSGISYQWTKNSKNIAGATRQTYATKQNGTYQVKESNAFSCSASSPTVSATKLPKPLAVIVPLGNLNICTTGSVTLQANAGTGLSYQWLMGTATIAGATQRTYVATVKGNYKCNVTNASDCSKTSNGLKVTKNCGKEGEQPDDLSQPVLSIYPNPTEGKFMLDLKTDEVNDGPAKIIVINIVGQVVYLESSSAVNGELRQEIDFPESAASGIYIAKVICNDHTYEGKIIYQH